MHFFNNTVFEEANQLQNQTVFFFREFRQGVKQFYFSSFLFHQSVDVLSMIWTKYSDCRIYIALEIFCDNKYIGRTMIEKFLKELTILNEGERFILLI